MKTTHITLLAIALCSASLFAAAPEQVTIPLTAQDKAGLEFVTAQFNAAEKSKHDSEQASLKEGERTAYVPLTEDQYAKLRLADVLKSWTWQYTQSRMSDPENIAFFEKATLLSDGDKAKIKAMIDAAAK